VGRSAGTTAVVTGGLKDTPAFDVGRMRLA
jgi:hypothetical protein